MRIHADITRSVAQGISDIKKLLISHLGPSFNDTGQVLEYCVNCTIQVLNDNHAKAQAAALNAVKEESNDQVEVGAGTSSGVQDSPVDGSGHDLDKGSIDSSEPHAASTDGPVDPKL